MAAKRTENLGVPGGGSALLSGLVRCGRCGLRMGVFYRSNGREARYRCGSAAVTYGDPECQSLQAWPVDDYVGALILEALTPSAIDVSLQLAEDIELERRQQYRQWDQRLERARYEVELAQRRYEAAEPENRLVTRTLERAWEAALAAQQQLQTEHARFTATAKTLGAGRTGRHPAVGSRYSSCLAGADDNHGRPASYRAADAGAGYHNPDKGFSRD